ncbi:Superfamily II DNA or RNA helicase [Mucilaginibacter pineti]|uniref:Superfamily II DNA or RNA helicase n=1 Tax=Mucilaginibacter pineti TaxID=1391627 RepID=A0A1G7NLF4_9SPHI|nr:DEAD/DEAH box helicase [Mucilaginibacter pineti]SDF74955.1 Superfamily II DNA or RNA helicase [Mucilaginibacter pineti]
MESTVTLYPYQEQALSQIFERFGQNNADQRLLFQLPTGGGKTMIFSEISRRYLGIHNQKVIVLTHRVELCNQTSATLKKLGIKNRIINSAVKHVAPDDRYACYVAMVETLNNRIESGDIDITGVGLVIIDEAHHNSFQKLLEKFSDAAIIGVTATPLSSDSTAPLNHHYQQLITGESIEKLIADGFLAKPTVWRYDVEISSLQTGAGDFTVSTSDELYSSPAMLDLLKHAYEAHAKGKKTLIFNNGIFTSKNVCQFFNDAGYPTKHLDNQTPPAERAEVLQWFKKTKGAILTSVSILTTGFDEPTIQAVILNRATTSLTLYHQMIGRGSRRLPQKKTFTIIDLGNNTERFGDWQQPVDWQEIFDHPEAYQAMLNAMLENHVHALPPGTRTKFPNSLEITFDVQEAHKRAVENNKKPKTVIRESLRQHVIMCVENAGTIPEALELTVELDKEIAWRVKQYAKCLGHVTANYKEWLIEDYKTKLNILVQKMMRRKEMKMTG